MSTGDVLWTAVERISAIITALGLPYLIVANRRRVPRLSFHFTSSARSILVNEGVRFCRFQFSGTVHNESLDSNSIFRIYLIVWLNDKRRAARRYGWGATRITEDGQYLTEPIALAPRGGKHLDIEFDVVLTGNPPDESLATATTPISPGSPHALPTYQYELAFEDILGNFFDQDGRLRNLTGIGLRWTLDNAIEALKGGNPKPFMAHWVRIWLSELIIVIRRNVRRLGI